MSLIKITRDLILSGQSSSEYICTTGQYQLSVGIDPDMPKDDSSNKPSGLIRPTAMAKFSGTEITGAPMWFISNPKDSNCYVYASDGKVHVVDSSLAMGAPLNSGSALSSSTGNGAAYYDNKIILIKNTDVAVYTLWGTPALNQTYWSSTLSLTALTNTTYPSINGVKMPNHVCYKHTDNKLYFCDVHANNYGIINYIKTTKGTYEGDTNDSSVYNALDFPYGWYPTAITAFDKYLLISLIEGTNTSVKQKPAKLALWDTISSSFEDVTPDNFSDPLITALINVNGSVYVFSGEAGGGCHVYKFMAVNMLQPVLYLPDVYPPLAGSVDHFMTRTIFGTKTINPSDYGIVYSLGSCYPDFASQSGLHGILKANTAGNNPQVTALKYFAQNATKPQPIIGWRTDTANGLDKISTTYSTSIFRDQIQRIGKQFYITKIQIPFIQAIAANMTLIVKAYFDSGSTNTTLATINNTNYPNSEKNIIIRPISNAGGRNDFYLEFTWSGTSLLTLSLPITIFIETIEDA